MYLQHYIQISMQQCMQVAHRPHTAKSCKTVTGLYANNILQLKRNRLQTILQPKSGDSGTGHNARRNRHM